MSVMTSCGPCELDCTDETYNCRVRFADTPKAKLVLWYFVFLLHGTMHWLEAEASRAMHLGGQ